VVPRAAAACDQCGLLRRQAVRSQQLVHERAQLLRHQHDEAEGPDPYRAVLAEAGGILVGQPEAVPVQLT
jgi:hypothetical protein